MALNREIWINTITENFYPDNSFMAKSIDDSAFVNNKTVHIPNAGKPSSVVINRSEKPAKIKEREDNELTYNIDELTTSPMWTRWNSPTTNATAFFPTTASSCKRQQHRTCSTSGQVA